MALICYRLIFGGWQRHIAVASGARGPIASPNIGGTVTHRSPALTERAKIVDVASPVVPRSADSCNRRRCRVRLLLLFVTTYFAVNIWVIEVLRFR